MQNWIRDVSRQASITNSFEAGGIGLHTGRQSRVWVRPAPAGTGIVFRRRGKTAPTPEMKAVWQNRHPALLCTALSAESCPPIRTVEHLLSSLSAFAIDNVSIELDGDELPIFDGSANNWCHSILKAGLQNQDAPRTYLRILKTIEVKEANGHFVRIEPAQASPALSFDISMEFPGFGRLRWQGEPMSWDYLRDIAPSRSFGLLQWGLPLKLYHLFSRQPLLRGANLWTTGIVFRGRFIGGMHVEEEPVRHRVLDLLGDIALAGHPLIGHVTAHCPRHDLNHAFVRALMEDDAAWEAITLNPPAKTPSALPVADQPATTST